METLNLHSALFKALLEITFLIAIGFLLRKIKFFRRELTDDLTKLILYLCLPALIFYSFITHLSRDTLKECGFFIGLSFILSILGFLLGWSFFRFFSKNFSLKREFISLVMFQNSGYLPLALISYLLPDNRRELAYLYIFSYLIGFNLIMLSFGFYYIKKDSNFYSKNLFSVPFVVSFIGVSFALLGVAKFIPSVILEPLHKIGETTIPLSMILLGMLFAESKFVSQKYLKDLSLLVLAKLIFLPLIIVLFLKIYQPSILVKLVTFIEAGMPSATTLSIIANYKKANVEFISQGIIFTHIFLIFTLPILFLIL